MGQLVIEKRATTSASPPVVYALLADGATWPQWSPLGSFELLEPGDTSPEGLGAVRRFVTGRHQSVERVVERTPDERFSYVLVKGMAIRDYRAVITLTPAASGGTAIEWRSVFRSKVPGTGWIYRAALGKFIGRTVQGLAAAATAASAVPVPDDAAPRTS